MTNPHSFGQILGTSTLLAFALSFNAFNLQASENGTAQNSLFVFAPKENTAVAYAVPTRHKAKVQGFAVKTAAVNAELGTGKTIGKGYPMPLPNPVGDNVGNDTIKPIRDEYPTSTDNIIIKPRPEKPTSTPFIYKKIKDSTGGTILIKNKDGVQALNATNTKSRQEQIQRLKERIKKMEYQLSELEKDVVNREKERERTPNTQLSKRLEGKLLIQPESNGEVWYLDPTTKQKFFLKDGEGAYQALKAFGTGVSESDFEKLANKPFGRQLAGKILLRVQSHGEAYYVDSEGVAHYLQNGEKAYELMKSKALGVSNADLSTITTGSLETEAAEPTTAQ